MLYNNFDSVHKIQWPPLQQAASTPPGAFVRSSCGQGGAPDDAGAYALGQTYSTPVIGANAECCQSRVAYAGPHGGGVYDTAAQPYHPYVRPGDQATPWAEKNFRGSVGAPTVSALPDPRKASLAQLAASGEAAVQARIAAASAPSSGDLRGAYAPSTPAGSPANMHPQVVAYAAGHNPQLGAYVPWLGASAPDGTSVPGGASAPIGVSAPDGTYVPSSPLNRWLAQHLSSPYTLTREKQASLCTPHAGAQWERCEHLFTV